MQDHPSSARRQQTAGPVHVGPYRLLAQVGQGGRGIVYRGRDTRDKKQVALKVLYSEVSRQSRAVQGFWQEFRLLQRLNHPNVIPVYEFGQANSLYYIASEYVPGGSLQDRLRPGQKRGLRAVLRMVQQVAAGLDAAHQHNVVHCDLKPANILLGRRGRVMLTDFGIARFSADRSRQASGAVMGTPDYMAPEQARPGQRVDHRADIYSLGVVTYQLLCGRLPFEREQDVAVLHAHVYETPPPMRQWRPRLSTGVENAVLWALVKEPAQRPQTASGFVRQLAAASGMKLDTIPPGGRFPWL